MEGDPCPELGTQKEQSWGLGNQGPIIHQGSQGCLGATWRRSMATGICGLARRAGTAVCVFPQWERMTVLREGAESRLPGSQSERSLHTSLPTRLSLQPSGFYLFLGGPGSPLAKPNSHACPQLTEALLDLPPLATPAFPSLSPQKCHSPVNLLGFFGSVCWAPHCLQCPPIGPSNKHLPTPRRFQMLPPGSLPWPLHPFYSLRLFPAPCSTFPKQAPCAHSRDKNVCGHHTDTGAHTQDHT